MVFTLFFKDLTSMRFMLLGKGPNLPSTFQNGLHLTSVTLWEQKHSFHKQSCKMCLLLMEVQLEPKRKLKSLIFLLTWLLIWAYISFLINVSVFFPKLVFLHGRTSSFFPKEFQRKENYFQGTTDQIVGLSFLFNFGF